MQLKTVRERVKALLPQLRSVGGATNLDAAMRAPVTATSAFVIPLADDADDSPRMGVTSQLVTSMFGVILAVHNVRGATGQDGLDELEPIKTQLRAALVGWVPDEGNGEPVTFMSGELLQAKGDGTIWWAEEFKVSYYLRSDS